MIVKQIKDDSQIFKIYNLKALRTLLSYYQSSEYTNSRDIILKTKVLVGYYVVIPSLDKNDVNVDFLLKIFTEESTELK